jgi:hypothetical protein
MCVSQRARRGLQVCCRVASGRPVVSGVITSLMARERIVRTRWCAPDRLRAGQRPVGAQSASSSPTSAVARHSTVSAAP